MNNLALETMKQAYCDDAIFGETVCLFREIALAVDENPGIISSFLDHPGISNLFQLEAGPNEIIVKKYELLSYGDVGVLLACPGQSLPGFFIEETATPQQQSDFLSQVAQLKAHTFMAITEPDYGSDAGQMKTFFEYDPKDDYLYVTGQKWLVGNVGFANLGVITGLLNQKLFGLCGLMILPGDLDVMEGSNATGTLTRYTLPMVGLRGARIGYLEMNRHPILAERLLGQHISVARRGVISLIAAFNKMRPGIAAMAIGMAQAILDYCSYCQPPNSAHKNTLKHLNIELDATRQLLYKAARHIDEKQPQQKITPLVSLVKASATCCAEQCIDFAIRYFGQGSLIEHPWLCKLQRDAHALEFLDGTSNLQRLNIYHGHFNGMLE